MIHRNTDAKFLDAMLTFYSVGVKHPIDEATATYILKNHFEAFSHAYSRFRLDESEANRAVAIELATRAIESLKKGG